MFETVVHWLTETIFALGYPGIIVLMALESSFFPFPSEVVLPPGGFLAAQGRMNLWLVFLSGTGGSLIGAVVNYYVAVKLGRPLLHKYSKYLLIQEKSLDRAERFFVRHGEVGTFVGRLIPVIRQYISLPAGLSRMNLARFSLYTGLGAGIWCGVLTYIGWFLGQNADVLSNEEVGRYTQRALVVIIPALVVLLVVYWLWHRSRKSEKEKGKGETAREVQGTTPGGTEKRERDLEGGVGVGRVDAE